MDVLVPLAGAVTELWLSHRDGELAREGEAALDGFAALDGAETRPEPAIAPLRTRILSVGRERPEVLSCADEGDAARRPAWLDEPGPNTALGEPARPVTAVLAVVDARDEVPRAPGADPLAEA